MFCPLMSIIHYTVIEQKNKLFLQIFLQKVNSYSPSDENRMKIVKTHCIDSKITIGIIQMTFDRNFHIGQTINGDKMNNCISTDRYHEWVRH